MVLETITEAISTGLNNAVQTMIEALPNVIAAIIILIIGYIIGKLLGSAVRKILEKIKLGEKLAKSTLIVKILAILNTTFERLLAALVSIFFYVIFILAAIDVLQIEMLKDFVTVVLLYLPNLIAGILVLIIGLIAVEWIVGFIRSTTKEYRIGGADLISSFFRVVLILVVIIITLDQWRIDTSIVYTFLQPIAWGIAAAIAVAFGWGFKDIVGDWGKKLAKDWGKENK